MKNFFTILIFLVISNVSLAEIIKDIPIKEEISIYKQGNFLDLCKGPHSSSTGKIGKFFKLITLILSPIILLASLILELLLVKKSILFFKI